MKICSQSVFTDENDANTSKNEDMVTFLKSIFEKDKPIEDDSEVSCTKSSKKSTSFSTTQLYVNTFPRELSNIETPSQNDVLCGRGKRVHIHEGNIRFRRKVCKHKLEFLMNPVASNTSNRGRIAAQVVLEVRDCTPPARFLELNKNSGLWNDIGDVRARKKASQSLRENSRLFLKTWGPEPI